MVEFKRYVKVALVSMTVAILITATGCKRSEEALDDRTLEKRSHVETVKPVDRKDAFRP